MNQANLDAYAIYSECPLTKDEVLEMGPNMVNRSFNTLEVEYGTAIRRAGGTNYEQIELQAGTYRITGVSILTMIIGSQPIVDTTNIYPGYCMVYDSAKPQNPANCICLGTPGTPLDTSPSLFDCILVCTKPTHISVGHQCSYDPATAKNKVYLRVGGGFSTYHVFARLAIFKVG